MRELYSLTPEAKIRGYKPGRFSFNVRGGRCEACKGDGTIKIEMHFLPDVYVPCETCHGRRYNKETLEVRFKGKSIADVLEMSVEEALEFFAKIPKIRRRLQTLHDVGLDYVKLGQPATTLSGGEAQRVKLASELSKVATGRTLYILDEPTTGLHFADIEKLLEVLQRLADAGNTVLVIEHNLDVIKQADWVVDLGPEGGEEGGELIAAGTPEEIAEVEELHRPLPAARARACCGSGCVAGYTIRNGFNASTRPASDQRQPHFPGASFGSGSSRGPAAVTGSGSSKSALPASLLSWRNAIEAILPFPPTNTALQVTDSLELKGCPLSSRGHTRSWPCGYRSGRSARGDVEDRCHGTRAAEGLAHALRPNPKLARPRAAGHRVRPRREVDVDAFAPVAHARSERGERLPTVEEAAGKPLSRLRPRVRGAVEC